MLFTMHGRRTARIKKHAEVKYHCNNCKSFDLDIKVYRDYYHFVLIPIVPVGEKTAKIYCNRCGEGLRTETIRKEYEATSMTPFYLYSGLILLGLMFVFIFVANRYHQKLTDTYVADPKAGDVYGMSENRNSLTIYYFIRVSKVKDDSIYIYPSNLEYYGYTETFDKADFFRKDQQSVFTKEELKLMLDTEAIHFVKRDYGDEQGFQRIK